MKEDPMDNLLNCIWLIVIKEYEKKREEEEEEEGGKG